MSFSVKGTLKYSFNEVVHTKSGQTGVGIYLHLLKPLFQSQKSGSCGPTRERLSSFAIFCNSLTVAVFTVECCLVVSTSVDLRSYHGIFNFLSFEISWFASINAWHILRRFFFCPSQSAMLSLSKLNILHPAFQNLFLCFCLLTHHQWRQMTQCYRQPCLHHVITASSWGFTDDFCFIKTFFLLSSIFLFWVVLCFVDVTGWLWPFRVFSALWYCFLFLVSSLMDGLYLVVNLLYLFFG